ncbi:MAG: nucleoside triphosphate pyrophosphohydrolase [Candidatus Magnetoovum sp. WYHC-5]|nr:nucleoside triphosphate pyrophosphohydrolase [Candidatus Magnetoovum sp. WYHC-5]
MELQKLLNIMSRLRSEDGCPWDRAQNHESLISYLIEETYELTEALDSKQPEHIKEELGDLLFQIVFHTQLAQEAGWFNMTEVIEKIAQKMVKRHPHVFANAKYETAEEVSKQWQERKKEEGKHQNSILEGIPKALPALLRAYRVQKRASRVGFDWTDANGAITKLEEEINELKDAIGEIDKANTVNSNTVNNSNNIEEELGDILFSTVNVSRLLAINPEEALRKATNKFIRRFNYIEEQIMSTGQDLGTVTLKEMDRLWDEAKIFFK